MKSNRFIFLLGSILILSNFVFAQAGSTYEQMLSSLKDTHVPAAAVDALLPQLQAIEKSEILSKDSQQVALDIFLHASYAYARNFHFKQGLLVFQGYLAMKDKFSLLDKSKAIQKLLSQHEQQQKNLDSEISKRKNAAGQLELDIESWKGMNGKFSRNYSLVVILVTAVLALVFIRINMNTVKAKNNLRDNRNKMSRMQRVATLGRFYNGNLTFLKSSTGRLSQKSRELTMFVKEVFPVEIKQNNTTVPDLMKQVDQAQQKLHSLVE